MTWSALRPQSDIQREAQCLNDPVKPWMLLCFLHLTHRCKDKNLIFNVQKTKDMVVDLHWTGAAPSVPTYTKGTVSSIEYLSIQLTNTLTWCTNTTAVIKKALYFQRTRLNMNILRSFYSCVMEIVMTTCLTVWSTGCTGAKKEVLQSGLHRGPSGAACHWSLIWELVHQGHVHH